MRKITNVKLAEIVAGEGYDFQEALKGIDAGRTSQDENKFISDKQIKGIIENICLSFEEEREAREGMI